MPWDNTRILVTPLDPTNLMQPATQAQVVPPPASGVAESALHPAWLDNNTVLFVSDRSNGWWNLHAATVGSNGEASQVTLFYAREGAEFAGPHWRFGDRPFAVLPDGAVVCLFSSPDTAGTQAAVLRRSAAQANEVSEVVPVALPFASVSFHLSVQADAADNLVLAILGGGATQPDGIRCARLSAASLASGSPVDSTAWPWHTLQTSIAESEIAQLEGCLAEPQALAFASGQNEAWCLFYKPTNKAYTGGLTGELPPLLIKIHGGPTASASAGFNPRVQYWTSRGFAVADVNYGGSTGFGRAYRQRLLGQWGVVDVDDCANCALGLAERGLVDRARLTIDGGSAGGFTTLACLAFKPSVFKAGASHYGVADLLLLAEETHKFEARYLDSLVGPLPASEATYKQRSPIHAADCIDSAVAFFHGDEDKVVPPNQAQVMFEALKAKGKPTAMVMFAGVCALWGWMEGWCRESLRRGGGRGVENQKASARGTIPFSQFFYGPILGEQHGFRRAENIRTSLDGELYFYSRVLAPSFEPHVSADFQPFEILNLH